MPAGFKELQGAVDAGRLHELDAKSAVKQALWGLAGELGLVKAEALAKMQGKHRDRGSVGLRRRRSRTGPAATGRPARAGRRSTAQRTRTCAHTRTRTRKSTPDGHEQGAMCIMRLRVGDRHGRGGGTSPAEAGGKGGWRQAVRDRRHADRGQLAVEFAGMVPTILVTMAVLWQCALTGYAFVLSGNVADKAVRAARPPTPGGRAGTRPASGAAGRTCRAAGRPASTAGPTATW